MNSNPKIRGFVTFGNRLRQLRKQHSRTLEYVAKKCDVSMARMSRIEAGNSHPTRQELNRILDLLQATPEERTSLITLMRAASWHIEPSTTPLLYGPDMDFQDRFLRYDNQYERIRQLAYEFVPGLLQTPKYAMGVTGAMRELGTSTTQQVTHQRLQRKGALFDTDRHFQFLLTEHALRFRYVSGPEMEAQLRQIRSLSSLPNVSLGIVPIDCLLPVHPYSFLLYDSDVVIVETRLMSFESRDILDIEKAEDSFKSLSQIAVWDDGARDLLKTLVGNLASESNTSEEGF